MLNSAFSNNFSGIVWRIKTDEVSQLLAVESRDSDTGMPSFSVIHYPTGSVLLHELHYGDRWWTIAGIHQGMLIVQAMSEAGPAAEGLAAIDCQTGKVVWETFQYRLQMLTNEGIFVYHRMLSGPPGELISFESGTLLVPNADPSFFKPIPNQVALPVMYEGQKPSWLNAETIHGPLFYCLYGQETLWAWHEPDNNAYNLRLRTEAGGKNPSNTLLLEHLPKLLLEPFFLLDGQIFCVTHTNRGISSYNLLTK
ncbi:protein of unknown function [bacterium A37T11]|nr:protein of unknown function [bacterium A37T11]